MSHFKLYCEYCLVLKTEHHLNPQCHFPLFHQWPSHLQKDDNPMWKKIMDATKEAELKEKSL